MRKILVLIYNKLKGAGRMFKNNGIIMSQGSSITINGVTYTGSHVSIGSNNIIIDGKEISTEGQQKVLITINGNVTQMKEVHAESIIVVGDVGGDVNTVNGNVTVSKDVKGDIDSVNGRIEIGGNCYGDIDTVNGVVINGKR